MSLIFVPHVDFVVQHNVRPERLDIFGKVCRDELCSLSEKFAENLSFVSSLWLHSGGSQYVHHTVVFDDDILHFRS